MLHHTFATRFLRATDNLALTRKALRHAGIQTTAEIYNHLVQENVDNGVGQGPGGEEYPERSPEEDEEVERLAEALAALPKEERKALANALLGSESG